MSDTVFCKKLKKEAKALTHPPMPTPLGKKIQKEISEEAWQSWQKHQTMIINEYRLNLADKTARDFLAQQMEQFLFTDKPLSPPPGFTESENKLD